MEHGNAFNTSETHVANMTCGVRDDEGMPSRAKLLFNRLANVEANTSLIWASMNKASSSKQPLSCPPQITVENEDINNGEDFGDTISFWMPISFSDDEEVRKKVNRRKMKVSKRHPKKDTEQSRGRGSQVSKCIGNKKKHSHSTAAGVEQPTTSKGVDGSKGFGRTQQPCPWTVNFGRKIPKDLKTRFFPSIDLGLTSDETPVAIYIFSTDVDFNEVIFKHNDTSGTIRLFDCLCPRRNVDEEILKFMAMKITWKQKHVNVQTVWELPPGFATDVLNCAPTNDVGHKYVKDWMPPYSCVKYIYVPIREGVDNWYLMVVSMENEVVYHLDPYPLSGHVKERRGNISKLCEKLVHFMTSDWLAMDFLNPPNDMGTWEIRTINPSQDNINSNHTALWVLEWMAMDWAFQPNVQQYLNRDRVRMKTAMMLFLEGNNEVLKTLEFRVEIYLQSYYDLPK
ncbi:Papain-like cysteine peptidase superfamily [Sesbania bispinosa]|nr:Papain-like cysteine peptidase superfamily [Sesbania bispinosa]